MKYLILSDIHGNIDALNSALIEVNSIKFDKYVVLGDLVSYGASPNEVVKRIIGLNPVIAIRGNHDKVAVGISDGRDFNYAARDAALWTRRKLLPENREYVSNLTKGPVEVDGLFEIVHGSPWDEEFYIFSHRHALNAFQHSDKKLIFFGHTHIPVIWSLGDDILEGEAVTNDQYEYSLEEGKRYLINPGSVGQPRDGNPKSSLAIFDSDEMKIQFLRIEYNIQNAQSKILQAGLDEYLADRLASGV